VNFIYNNMADAIQLLVVNQPAEDNTGGAKQYPRFRIAF
jgi:hypothetical protein